MAIIITLLITALLTTALPYLDGIIESLVPIALHAETFMSTLSGTNWFESVYDIFFNFGISMIVLKFLYKGFTTYIAWTDGDADADPMGLLTNFLRALAIAICFPVMYTWMTDIAEDLIERTMDAIGVATNIDHNIFVGTVATGGLFTGIITLIFFIMYIILYTKFLIRGLEILILRIGLPFACVGLIDNDKGVFGAYIKKFYQSVLTVVVQISLCKLAMGMMLSAHIFWGIACMSMALKVPQILSEFMLVGGGGGGIMSKAFYASSMARTIKTLVTKK